LSESQRLPCSEAVFQALRILAGLTALIGRRSSPARAS
jgi:hypothetical protein